MTWMTWVSRMTCLTWMTWVTPGLARGASGEGGLGRALQLHPIEPNSKPPGTKRLKLKCDEPLSK